MQLNNKLMFPDGTEFYLDAKGGIRGYNTSATRGADTFCPFSNFTGRRIWNNFWGAGSEGNYPVRWPVPDGINMVTLVTAIGIYSGAHYCSLSGAGIISKKDILDIVGTGMDTARLQIWEISTKPGDDIVITLHVTGYPIARVSCAIFY